MYIEQPVTIILKKVYAPYGNEKKPAIIKNNAELSKLNNLSLVYYLFCLLPSGILFVSINYPFN